jgi:hypothetical protein
LSAPFLEEGRRSILFATGTVIFFEEIPQLIIYSVYMGSHIKPAIIPILVLSSCSMVLLLKSISLLCSKCCYGKGPGDKPLGTISTSSGSDDEKDDGFATHNISPRTQDDKPLGTVRTSSSSNDEKDDGFAPYDNRRTTHNIPTKTQDRFQDGEPKDGGPYDRDIGKATETDNTEVTEEITETIEITETTETKAKPRTKIDSTIRDSTVENYDNTRKRHEVSKDLEETSTSTSGGGECSFGASIPVYCDLGSAPKNNNKSDKLNIAAGAAISGVTVAGGSTIRYIIVYLDDEKKEKVTAIKTTITKTSSPDGDKYITRTDNGKEYITIHSEGKYITKTSTGNEEYITRAVNDEEYVTKTISGEEYITIITNNDDKEYITKSKSISGKGKGQVEYIILSSSKSSKTFTTSTEIETDENGIETIDYDEDDVKTGKIDKNVIEDKVITTITTKDSKGNVINSHTVTGNSKILQIKTEIDESGIVTETETEIKTDENGNTITKVTTTKKNSNGKVLETNIKTKYN